MIKNLLFTLFFSFLIQQFCFAQDSIVLYNGKHIMGDVNDNKNQTFISYTVVKKKKSKIKYLYKENIFAIHYKDSITDIFYTPDITEENPFTIDEMRRFISGENLARHHYHPRWATACGVVAGVGGIYFGIYGLLIPTAYVAITSSVPVSTKRKKYIPEDKKNDEIFLEGFKQEAKRKKLINSVVGGVSGAVFLGTTLGILTGLDYKNWGK